MLTNTISLYWNFLFVSLDCVFILIKVVLHHILLAFFFTFNSVWKSQQYPSEYSSILCLNSRCRLVATNSLPIHLKWRNFGSDWIGWQICILLLIKLCQEFIFRVKKDSLALLHVPDLAIVRRMSWVTSFEPSLVTITFSWGISKMNLGGFAVSLASSRVYWISSWENLAGCRANECSWIELYHIIFLQNHRE